MQINVKTNCIKKKCTFEFSIASKKPEKNAAQLTKKKEKNL